MRKVLGGGYRAETHAAGEGGEEERAVHDGEDAGRDWRSGLLQDTALESDTQIEAWAGGVRLVYDMTETGASDGTGARRMCLFLCAAMFTHGHAVVTGRHKVTPKRPGNGIAGG